MTAGTDSPSGTVLRHTGNGSNWVLASELTYVARKLRRSAANATDWLGTSCKYLEIRVDMRGGNFIILDNHGYRVDGNDEVLAKFGITNTVEMRHDEALEWEDALTALLTKLAQEDSETGRQAEGLGQSLPKLRALLGRL